MKTVLALAGSLRRDSFNRLLLQAAAQDAPSSLKLTLYDGVGAIPLFNEDVERATGGGPEAVRSLRDAVASADGLLIATPEYNQSIPGVLKNVIDWLSRPAPEEVLVGKPISIIGASGGRWGTRLAQAALRQVLTATESIVMPQPAVFVREAAQQFDESGRLIDDATRAALTANLAAFERWMEAFARKSR
jgi:NAD(P)H-dependent FMN reductase